jgi:hypothetical protein
MKLVPVMVRVVSPAPAAMLLGLTEVIFGPLMVNVLEAELTVLELWTVTLAVPAAATCALVTAAVSEVALTYVVVSAVDPHITVEVLKKFVPVTVRVKSLAPAATELGLKLVMVGVAGLIVKLVALLIVPSLFTTVTGTVAALAIMSLVTAPVSLEALEKVVVSAVVFHMMVAPETNPEPFTVSVKAAPPALADVGLRLEMVAGVPTTKATGAELAPFCTART